MAAYPLLEKLKKLISALSSAQKRDFRRYIQSLGGDNTRYVRLFDAINEWLKLKKFPEKFLTDLTTRKVIRKPEEFSVVAGILYEKILESMRNTPRSRAAKNQIRGIISDIQFLADIELYPESLALLDKARELAKKFDYPPYLLDLLSVEREILFLSRRSDFFQRLEEIRTEEDLLIQRLTTDQLIYSLNIATLKRLVQNDNVPEESSISLNDWRNLAATNPADIEALPFRTQRRLNIALMNDIDFYSGKEDSRAATRLQYAQNIVQLYELFPQFKSEEPDLYIQHLGMFLSLALEQGAGHFFEQAKSDLPNLEGTAGFCRWVAPVYLHWYYQSEAYAAGCKFIDEMDLAKQIETFHDKMTPSRYMTICFTAFELCWLNKQPNDALDWLNRIIMYKPASFQLDLQCFARFLQIPVLCDCGIFKAHLTPLYVTEGLQRWLRKHNFTTPFHQSLLGLMKEIAVTPETFHSVPANVKVIAALEKEMSAGAVQTNPLTLILVWLKARQEKKSMDQVVKRFLSKKQE